MMPRNKASEASAAGSSTIARIIFVPMNNRGTLFLFCSFVKGGTGPFPCQWPVLDFAVARFAELAGLPRHCLVWSWGGPGVVASSADREETMSFRIFALAGATAVLLAVPLPTNLSAQPSVEVGPGGVRVGHDRRDSRRRDERERRGERGERERRGGCKTVTIREPRPGGGEKITKRRECD